MEQDEHDAGTSSVESEEGVVELEEKQLTFESFVKEATELLLLLEAWNVEGTKHLAARQPQKIGEEISPALDTAQCAEFLLQKNYKRIVDILDKYQEQPHLLDPHLERLITPLMQIARGFRDTSVSNPSTTQPAEIERSSKKQAKFMYKTFKLLYVICKVRGYKTAVRFFPHEVKDLEPTWTFLKQGSGQEIRKRKWEVDYILLLWLSVILYIPFSLTTVVLSSTIEDLLETGKSILASPAKTRDAAAEMLSRLLTRPDMEAAPLDAFLHWADNSLLTSDTFLRTGILSTLANIFKKGRREVLKEKVSIIFAKSISMTSGSLVQRWLCMKLTQRLGLAHLKPRQPKWRYRRGIGSLLQNLGGTASQHGSGSNDEQETEEDYDIPREIEEVIDTMLTGLRDKDTVVRWSAAKGVGRITERLPKELGGDVVQSVLELFSSSETDCAWHGGCLALAECARRGLLLASHLQEVVPLIIKALHYDVRRGAHSIGTHVRDAACYVCWAFGRAYAPDVMQSHVSALAPALILTALFDREINCRRAASAAFQENVGRQGSFPKGIEIIQLADYFSLGNRKDAYLNISYEVAKLSLDLGTRYYLKPMIDHLVNVKLFHWDISLRTLAAQALRTLVELDRSYFIDAVLPGLIRTCTETKDLNTRHGSIVGVAEIVFALFAPDKGSQAADQNLTERITAIVPELDKARLYTGRGSEIIRQAASRLIECIAMAHLPLNDPTTTTTTQQPQTPQVHVESTSTTRAAAAPSKPKPSLQDIRNKRAQAKTKRQIYMETIQDNLKHPKEVVCQAAVLAFHAFTKEYYSSMPLEWRQKFVARFTEPLQDKQSRANVSLRRGYCSALGYLPPHLVQDASLARLVVPALTFNIKLEETASERDPESRQRAADSLGRLAETFTDEGILTYGQDVFKALLEAVEDYSVDDRGDVGSWVREAAVVSLEKWASRMMSLPSQDSSHACLLGPDLAQRFMSKLLGQMADKLDKTRLNAGQVFERILHVVPIPQLPHKEDILAAFPKDSVINWSSSSETFPRLTPLLRLECYCDDLLAGLVTCAGGITRSLAKDAGDALLQHLKAISTVSSNDSHCETKEASTLPSSSLQLEKENESPQSPPPPSSSPSTSSSSTPKDHTIYNNNTTTTKDQPVQSTEAGSATSPSLLLLRISKSLVMLFKNHQNDDRIVGPLLKTILLILTSSNLLRCLAPPKFAWSKNIITLCRTEMRQCKDIPKLKSIASVLCAILISFGEPSRTEAMVTLVGLLTHRYPKVRGWVAEQLYTSFIALPELFPSHHTQEITNILCTARWEEDLADATKQRDILCTLAGLRIQQHPSAPSGSLTSGASSSTVPSTQSATSTETSTEQHQLANVNRQEEF